MSETQAVVIDKSVPLEVACLIGCAVVTGTGAVLNRAKVQPGQSVVVIGAGGIGQSVIQAARLAAAGRIVVVDANPAKEAVARQFGATDFVDGSAVDDAVAAVKDLGLPAAPTTSSSASGIRLSSATPSTCSTGAVRARCSVSRSSAPRRASSSTRSTTTSRSSAAGTARPVHTTTSRCSSASTRTDGCKLDEMVSQRYPMGDIRQALDDMHAGKLNRGVLDLTPT